MPDRPLTAPLRPQYGSTESILDEISDKMDTGLPYGADQQVISYVGSTNNISTIVFKRAGITLKTRTFSYAGAGAADNDKLTGTQDS